MLGRGGFDPAATVLARQVQRVFLACSLSLGVCGVLSIHSLRHSLMLSVFHIHAVTSSQQAQRLAVFEALCHLDCLQDLPTWIDRLQTDIENCAVHQNTQHLETVYWCYAPIDVVYMVYSDAYVMMCACVLSQSTRQGRCWPRPATTWRHTTLQQRQISKQHDVIKTYQHRSLDLELCLNDLDCCDDWLDGCQLHCAVRCYCVVDWLTVIGGDRISR